MPETETTPAPALEPEDWDYFLSGGIRKHTLQDAVECAERGRRDLTPRALAALALHGESYGFTREDVALLDRMPRVCQAIWRQAQGEIISADILDDAHSAFYDLGRLSDRIAALLPPP